MTTRPSCPSRSGGGCNRSTDSPRRDRHDSTDLWIEYARSSAWCTAPRGDPATRSESVRPPTCPRVGEVRAGGERLSQPSQCGTSSRLGRTLLAARSAPCTEGSPVRVRRMGHQPRTHSSRLPDRPVLRGRPGSGRLRAQTWIHHLRRSAARRAQVAPTRTRGRPVGGRTRRESIRVLITGSGDRGGPERRSAVGSSFRWSDSPPGRGPSGSRARIGGRLVRPPRSLTRSPRGGLSSLQRTGSRGLAGAALHLVRGDVRSGVGRENPRVGPKRLDTTKGRRCRARARPADGSRRGQVASHYER